MLSTDECVHVGPTYFYLLLLEIDVSQPQVDQVNMGRKMNVVNSPLVSIFSTGVVTSQVMGVA